MDIEGADEFVEGPANEFALVLLNDLNIVVDVVHDSLLGSGGSL
jgi:hypothetical protein